MKNNKIILYIIICVLVALSFYLFVCVSDLKDDSTNDESCNNIYASEEYKTISSHYNATFSDNIGIISHVDGSLYLKADNVDSIEKLYKTYTHEEVNTSGYDFFDVNMNSSLEAYKFDISSVKDVAADMKNNENIFFALLESGNLVYISKNDILNGQVSLKVVEGLSNIDSIYEKEKGNEILGLYAVDNGHREYKIIDYIK